MIETYGCQMNVHDSERMAGLLEQAGYEPTADDRDADVIVINTCSVRERAEEKLFTRLGEIPPDGAARPGTGRSSRSPAASRSRKARRFCDGRKAVDVIVGTQNLKRLPMLVESGGRHAGPPAPRDRSRSARRRVVSAGHRAAERPAEGLRHDHRGLQRVLRLLRRAVHARARADAAGGRHPRGGAARGRHRRAGRSSCSGRS